MNSVRSCLGSAVDDGLYDARDNKMNDDTLGEDLVEGNPVSKKTMRLYLHLMKINDELSRFQEDKDKKAIPISSFVLLGLQSAGKTSVLNVLIGCYAGFSSADTATRCIVEYTLKHNPQIEKTRFMVDGDSVQDLGKRLGEIFKLIAKTEESGFSTTPCKVVIEGKDIMNLMFIDTPGFTPVNKEKNENITRIISPVLQQRENIFIIVSKDGDTSDNDPTLDTLKPLFTENIEWRQQAIFIMTGADLTLVHKNKARFITQIEKLKEYYGNPKDLLFISCNPDNINIEEELNNDREEISSYIKKIPDKDAEMWESFFKRVNLPREAQCHTGMWRLKNMFERAIKDTMDKNYDTVAPTMTRIEDRLRKKLRNAEEEMYRANPQNLRELLRKFRIEYKETIHLYNETNYTLNEDLSAHKTGFLWSTQWDEMKYDTESWHHLLVPNDLSEALKGNNQWLLNNWLHVRMKGQMAAKRAIDVFGFLMVSKAMRTPAYSEIWDAARPMTTSDLDYHHGVQYLTAKSLEHLGDGLSWLADTLQWICNRSADTVYEYLLKNERYKKLRKEPFKVLGEEVSRRAYKRVVDRTLKQFRSKGKESLRSRTAVLNPHFANIMRRVAKSFWPQENDTNQENKVQEDVKGKKK